MSPKRITAKHECEICHRWYDDSTSEKRARHFASAMHRKARGYIGF